MATAVPQQRATILDLPDFQVPAEVTIVAVQGDWGVRATETGQGRFYLVADTAHATDRCLSLIDLAQSSGASLVLIPELAVPRAGVDELLARLWTVPQDVLLLAGLESVSADDYRVLQRSHDGAVDLERHSAGNCVNPLLVAAKTRSSRLVRFRAKRVGSRVENHEVNFAAGTGPFLVVRLGHEPLTVLPLVCAELVWPELWSTIDSELPEPAQIDLMPVLQLNNEPGFNHVGNELSQAYRRGRQTTATRFVLANHALGPDSDGNCYVVVPPQTPAPPEFVHTRGELWHLPGVGYKGFRIPDRTGCFWHVKITAPRQTQSALGIPICRGAVAGVWHPAGVSDVGGLVSGLLRTAAFARFSRLIQTGRPASGPAFHVVNSLDREHSRFLLRGIDRALAAEIFPTIVCDCTADWPRVEGMTRLLLKITSSPAAGGEDVRVEVAAGSNCSVAGRPVAVLYAPTVDSALKAKFDLGKTLSSPGAPRGVVLVGVEARSVVPNARSLADVLRADRIGSNALDLVDAPIFDANSAVNISAARIRLCELSDLRPVVTASEQVARTLLHELLPGIFL